MRDDLLVDGTAGRNWQNFQSHHHLCEKQNFQSHHHLCEKQNFAGVSGIVVVLPTPTSLLVE
jgi:hypothetical protein